MEERYCTYLTVYRGGRFPPFYIGSSTLERVLRGYRGSPQSKDYGRNEWKDEQRTRPDLFRTFVLTRHHTLREARKREESFHVALDVLRNDLYLNRSIARPDSMGGFEIGQGPNRGKKLPEKWRKNIAVASTGRVFDESSRLKKSESLTKFYSELDARRWEERDGMYGKTDKTRARQRQTRKEMWNGEWGERERARRASISTEKRVWIVTHPDGRVEEVYPLGTFCKERGVSQSNLMKYGKSKGYKIVLKE